MGVPLTRAIARDIVAVPKRVPCPFPHRRPGAPKGASGWARGRDP